MSNRYSGTYPVNRSTGWTYPKTQCEKGSLSMKNVRNRRHTGMICTRCWGLGWVSINQLPCPECKGHGKVHCCDGDQANEACECEQPEKEVE